MREEKVRVTAFNVGTTNARVAYFISRHEEDKVLSRGSNKMSKHECQSRILYFIGR